MSFSSTNLEVIHNNFSNGWKVFAHRTTENHSAVEATGYFTNGRRLGMGVGDLLCNVTASSAVTWHVVTASTGAVSAASSDSAAAWGQAFNVTISAATT